MSDKEFSKYPKTDEFEVIDTMGVPHPYCITHHHVSWAADRHGGMLTAEAVRGLEKSKGRPCCGAQGCNIMFDEHKQALAVRYKVKDNDKLKAYLESIVKQAEEDGYVGFVLVDGTATEASDAAAH